ncbi:hypothetical protein EGW08_018553 [Elysia chlorotica]|uniref:Centrosomal protein POC5 n=1 Tax=Elysia chlorotica TaxID=188477 RepID=A0A3S1H7C9_ELYCH|nr:hypothetical protein EGW08_018553 [Elysia chlorotica]
MSDVETSPGRSSPPQLPPESPGSSVSTRMQEEYTELLKFALTGGLHDSPEAQGGELDGWEETSQSVASLVPTLRPEQQEEEGDPGEKEDQSVESQILRNSSENDSNSNNMYADSVNENAKVVIEFDSDTLVSGQNSSQFTVTPDVNVVGENLDTWLAKLKGDILGELGKAVVKSMKAQQEAHKQEIKDLVADKQRLQRESTRLAEEVSACEQSLARKDTLVENLTQALQASKDKVKLAKLFYTSRAEAADQRRLAFTEKLAERHHEQQLVQRVMRAWFGLIQTRWRTRVSKGCEEQARSVCGQLSQDYEDKIKCLNSTIAILEQKVSFLQQERGQYAEQVRKAFMRGVCALNMETMSAFGPEEDFDVDPSTGHSLPRTVSTGPAVYQEESSDDQNYSHNANNQPLSGPPITQEFSSQNDRLGGIQQQEQQQHQHQHQQQQRHQHKEPQSLPLAEVQISSGAITSGTVGVLPRSLPTFTHKTKVKQAKPKGRLGSAPGSASTRHIVRATGPTNQNQPLAPPMASVVVERHSAVTKQTLGKATAMRYPKSAMGQVSRSQPSSMIGQSFKPLAGQSGSLTMVSSSIKVVE